MKCPECGQQSRVKTTRKYEAYTLRNRFCPSNHKFCSMETHVGDNIDGVLKTIQALDEAIDKLVSVKMDLQNGKEESEAE